MDNEVKNITNRRHIGRNIQRIRVYLGMKQEACLLYTSDAADE